MGCAGNSLCERLHWNTLSYHAAQLAHPILSQGVCVWMHHNTQSINASIHQQSNHRRITSHTAESQYNNRTMRLCPRRTQVLSVCLSSQIMYNTIIMLTRVILSRLLIANYRGPGLRGPCSSSYFAGPFKKWRLNGAQTSFIGLRSALALSPTVPPVDAKR